MRSGGYPPRLIFASDPPACQGTGFPSNDEKKPVSETHHGLLPTGSWTEKFLSFAVVAKRFVLAKPKSVMAGVLVPIVGFIGYLAIANADPKIDPGAIDPGKVVSAETPDAPIDVVTQSDQEFTVQEIVSMYDKSICRIEAGRVIGTGFVIGPKLVVSNRHVIESSNASSIRLFFSDGSVDPVWTSYRVSDVLTGSGHEDLVVLKVPQLPELKEIPIESISGLQRGEPIIVIGNPDGYRNVVSEGNFGSIQTIGGQKYVQLTSTIHPGNSGGPAITKKGKLAGVVTLKSSNEGIGFAIPGEKLYEFLDETLGN